jgi:subtilisin family serine protease
MSRNPFVVCSLLVLFAAAAPARSRLDEYALILSDAPVAEKTSSRVMLRSAAAESHRARIAAAQRTLAAELAKRKIRVNGAVQVVANAVFVRVPPARAAELRSLPGVVRVQYLPPIHKNLNTAADLVNATTAWNAVGGMSNAGAGVKIAIIDTGIDNTHPAFQDTALQAPGGFPKGDTGYTNNKIIVARSYVAQLPGPTRPSTVRTT